MHQNDKRGIYRHFKGKYFELVAVATHTETHEKFVIYRGLYGDYQYYASPYSMFFSEVDHELHPNALQKNRFQFTQDIGNWRKNPVLTDAELRLMNGEKVFCREVNAFVKVIARETGLIDVSYREGFNEYQYHAKDLTLYREKPCAYKSNCIMMEGSDLEKTGSDQ